jgi:hypothetical protein
MTDNHPRERIFTYVGTVAGLALTLESGPASLVIELGRQAHRLGSLLREQWPVSVWQLIPRHDRR